MSLLDTIEQWAVIASDRIALRSSAGAVSYGDLQQRSDALACWLRKRLGAGAEPVLLFGHKEPEMLVCFLACAKAGRPYIPVDVEMPAARVEKIRQHSQAVLTIAVQPAPWAAADDATIILGSELPALWQDFLYQRPSLAWRAAEGETFYIIYTSGSTGDPKGVQISVANLEAFVAFIREDLPIRGGARWLNQAPFCFDLSIMDVYGGLVTGSTVGCISQELVVNPLALREQLRVFDPQIWCSTPSFVEMCLRDRQFDTAHLPGLSLFLFCGEPLTARCVRGLRQRFPEARVYNLYGPTEATVAVSSVLVDDALLAAGDPLPLGKPMAGCELSVVAEDGGPTTDGELGEIVITGASVSPGYYRAPELTADRFVGAAPTASYLTGDLGYRRGAHLYFVGRKDFQIKLSGHRIELADIEANLRELPGVDAAVVIPELVEGRCASLCAFVASAEPLRGEDLRKLLAARLPPYMVPRHIEVLDELPRNVSGKADRAALIAKGDVFMGSNRPE